MNARDELAGIIQREYVRAIDRKRVSDCYDAPADAILAAGYRKPRIITQVVGANVLPWGSVIRTPQGYVMEKLTDGWYRAGVDFAYKPNPKWLPATVLHEGGAA